MFQEQVMITAIHDCAVCVFHDRDLVYARGLLVCETILNGCRRLQADQK